MPELCDNEGKRQKSQIHRRVEISALRPLRRAQAQQSAGIKVYQPLYELTAGCLECSLSGQLVVPCSREEDCCTCIQEDSSGVTMVLITF